MPPWGLSASLEGPASSGIGLYQLKLRGKVFFGVQPFSCHLPPLLEVRASIHCWSL